MKDEKLVELTERATGIFNVVDNNRTVKAENELEIVSAIPVYKVKLTNEDLPKVHDEVMTANGEPLETNKNNQFRFGDRYDGYYQEFKRMMNKYQTVGSGHLGRIFGAKHETELKPSDERPIRSPPYRAGPRQSKLESDEVNKTLNEGVPEPAVSEEA